MLNIFYSNKIEALSAQLCSQLAVQPLPALTPELIVVESSAMAQWLTQSMTRQLGIAAHIQFPFPAAVVWQIYRQQMPSLPLASSFDIGPLTWKIYALLNHHDLRCMPELAAYVGCLKRNKQRLHFAEHIARLYDQYQIYRPDWLCLWNKGENDHWQAKLWRLLSQSNSQDPDRAEIFSASTQLFPMPENSAKDIAQRLNVFAVASMPDAYVQLLLGLSASIDINIYVLNPSPLFWQDIRSEKQSLTLTDTQPDFFSMPEQHNELLALMAKQGRDYIALLQQCGDLQEHDCFVEVDKKDLLGQLQNDILLLRQPQYEEQKAHISNDDNSIQVHSCHSPMREVQVLHDQLLRILDESSHIALDDIVIMVPDLENYAPYFHAVFGTASESLRMVYHLAERFSLEDQPIKHALLQLLSCHATQYRRSDIISLLQEPVIASKFGIEDLALIGKLLDDLQVRFSLQDKEWCKLGDDVVSFSWQQAYERLIDSFAFAEVSADGVAEIVSEQVLGVYDDVADQAGRLCEFIDKLVLLELQNKKQSLFEWCSYIKNILDVFFNIHSSADESEFHQIMSVLEKIEASVSTSGFNEMIEFELFQYVLESELQKNNQHHFFRHSAINIATLLPMRSLPFKVVCLLGMNEGVFPRPASIDAIDLMLDKPRKGDRNRREEDRYLFLEALLAARECVYISYIGNSAIDNEERYPSLLVSELIDHIDASYTLGNGHSIRDHLCLRHPLQPFDRRYFLQQRRYFSYNQSALNQAKKLQSHQSRLPAFSNKVSRIELPEIITLNDLQRSLSDSSAVYLSSFNISFWQDDNEDIDAELFKASGLDRYQLLNLIFRCVYEQQPLPDSATLVRAGMLPQSAFAQTQLDELVEQVKQLQEIVIANHLDLGQGKKSLSLTIAGKKIEGELDACNQTGTQRLAILANKLHGKHIIKAWVVHVFACAAAIEHKSYLLSADLICYKMNSIEPPLAQEILSDMVAFAVDSHSGLTNFFPKSAWRYIYTMAEKGCAVKAKIELEKSLIGSHMPGELSEASNAYAYRGQEMDIERIMAVAEKIFNPVLDYIERLDDSQPAKFQSNKVRR